MFYLISNLFSIFDPSDLFGMSLNWCSFLIFMIVGPSAYWISPNPSSLVSTKFVMVFFSEFKNNLMSTYYNGSLITFVSLLCYILVNNFMGLFPYVFTSSSHLTFSAALSVPVWLGLYVFMVILSGKSVLAHLVPKNSPMLLAPLMVLVELLSGVIRPLTLAVRLSANMIAGHLLIALLSMPCVNSSLLIISTLTMVLLLLMLLELSVACIQSYVFSVLSSLYYSEASLELNKV